MPEDIEDETVEMSMEDREAREKSEKMHNPKRQPDQKQGKSIPEEGAGPAPESPGGDPDGGEGGLSQGGGSTGEGGGASQGGGSGN